ncbi:MAG: alcohol dehydrogenase catalytic domain-containing protein [Armatimonadetes bacterium]|nr:alcohol dehydrogenase catalytic domain-containing protein [Armatimonadota bacterium]CUU38469.1 L-gulonate 5-dehydrogenase [Armatimonadetes bacterium DC]
MRAFRLVAPHTVQRVELPDPAPQPNEALVEVLACGVCGTDLHLKNLGHGAWRGNPLTLGHEIVGRIAHLPADYRGALQVSDPVVIDPQIVCGACYFCRRGRLNLCERLEHIGISTDGGFADYIAVPPRNLYRVPEGDLPLHEFALVEPVATCVAGMNLANPRPDEPVAVVGLGFFGQIYLQLARLWGVQTLFGIDPLPHRRELASQHTQAHTATPEEARELILAHTDGRGASVVVDAAGSPTAAQTCVELASKAGRIIVFGYRPEPVQVDWYQILVKELTVIGSRSSNHAWEHSLTLVAQRKLRFDGLTQTYPFDAIEQAFADAEAKKVYKPIVQMR